MCVTWATFLQVISSSWKPFLSCISNLHGRCGPIFRATFFIRTAFFRPTCFHTACFFLPDFWSSGQLVRSTFLHTLTCEAGRLQKGWYVRAQLGRPSRSWRGGNNEPTKPTQVGRNEKNKANRRTGMASVTHHVAYLMHYTSHIIYHTSCTMH